MIQLLSSCNHSQQVFSQMALKLMAMLAIVFLVFLDIIIFIVIFTHQINARFPMLKRITLLTYTLMIQLGLSVGSYSYQPLYLGVPTRVSFYTYIRSRAPDSAAIFGVVGHSWQLCLTSFRQLCINAIRYIAMCLLILQIVVTHSCYMEQSKGFKVRH